MWVSRVIAPVVLLAGLSGLSLIANLAIVQTSNYYGQNHLYHKSFIGYMITL
jgi:hypothetical protein